MLLLTLASALAQTLPRVLTPVEPAFPEAALAEGTSAVVVVRAVLDSKGEVKEAEVIESAGPLFDQPALDAVRSTRFSPALDELGNPAFAEISYSVRFEADRAPPVSAAGRVKVAGSREPGSGFLVIAEAEEARRVVTTDVEGLFELVGLASGPWSVRIEAAGFESVIAEIDVQPGKVVELVFTPRRDRPWEDDADVDETVVVRARPPAVEVSERVLSTEDIRYLPGTGGDIVKAIQNLPGVARPPFGIGQLLIRGTAPEDSAYYLDGAKLPTVFHFAGLATVVNGDILDEVALLSGNYSTRYGRTLGGVVDLRANTDLPENSRGYASVDLFQATGFVEQRVGEKTALSVSGRRSYIDAVLTPVLSGLGSSNVRAPRYYDFQVRALHHTDQGVVDAMFLLSDDAFRVVGDKDDADEVQIGLTERFQKVRVRWTHDLGEGWAASMSFMVGPESRSFAIAPNGSAFERTTALNNRVEVTRAYRGGPLAWRGGIDLYTGSFAFDYDLPAFGASEKGSVWFTSPSPYLEPSVRTGPLEVTAGVRVDPWILDSGYSAVAVDPRLVARIDAADSTRFEAAVGQFSQFPGIREVNEAEGGNPNLKPERSIQASVGIEQRLGPLDVEVTAFGNSLDRLVVGREDAFRFFSGPPPAGPLDTNPYANEGTGLIGGVEALVKIQTKRTLGWVSATFSRSTRVKRPEDKERLFEYDQPVVINALASYQLPKRWRIGARARFGSGNPFTPVVNRVYDLDRRQFQPVYGVADSARLPFFFSADVRIDKDIVFRNWTLTGYLDVQNVTNRQNVDIMGWTDDFSEEAPVNGLPLVPAFGVKAAW